MNHLAAEIERTRLREPTSTPREQYHNHMSWIVQCKETIAHREQVMRDLWLAEAYRLWGAKPGVIVKRSDVEYVIVDVYVNSTWPRDRPPLLKVLKLDKHGLPGTRVLTLWGSDWRLA